MPSIRSPFGIGTSSLLLLVLACQQQGDPTSEPTLLVDDSNRAIDLFERHCAVCHGFDGLGDGEAAPFLFPPARSFASGNFRLVSTANRVPTDEDLIATMRRGMPGSSMPSWNWLEDSDLQLLASHVRRLAVDGLADQLVDASRAHDDLMPFLDALDMARKRLEPGQPLPTPAVPRDTDTTKGAELYAANCALCHGSDGAGSKQPQFNENGDLNWARNLTAGFVKGGVTSEALAHRIGAGLPGSAMPAFQFQEDELVSLIAHVKSMIPERTEMKLVQTSKHLRVARSEAAVPTEPNDPAWQAVHEIDIVLAPLRWTDESIVYATIGAIHDGQSIAIRVRWPDVTGDNKMFSDVLNTDGVALQLSKASAPPLFGMGTSDRSTTVWYWKATRFEEVAGALDLIDPASGLSEDSRLSDVATDAPTYRGLDGVPEVSHGGDSMIVRGVESVEDTARNTHDITVSPMWTDGEWSVVFKRPLISSKAGQVEFASGESVQLSCAIWNGAAGDLGPQKSISIWHELQIE